MLEFFIFSGVIGGMITIAAIWTKDRRLYMFMLPLCLGFVLVNIAGLMRGSLTGDSGGAFIAYPFLTIELLMVIMIVYQLRFRLSAILLAPIVLFHALVAVVWGTMDFQGVS